MPRKIYGCFKIKSLGISSYHELEKGIEQTITEYNNFIVK
jgi:hypothetical protein